MASLRDSNLEEEEERRGMRRRRKMRSIVEECVINVSKSSHRRHVHVVMYT
jgi:hypothetical protein